jgi:hypothetical protein
MEPAVLNRERVALDKKNRMPMCWRFGPARTVNRPVNLLLRVPDQMG